MDKLWDENSSKSLAVVAGIQKPRRTAKSWTPKKKRKKKGAKYL